MQYLLYALQAFLLIIAVYLWSLFMMRVSKTSPLIVRYEPYFFLGGMGVVFVGVNAVVRQLQATIC